MGRVIAVANQKGGVGKTTTAINLSACLAEKGQKVLAIDMDPQGNMTSGLGIDKDEVEKNIYDLMIGQVGVEEVLQKEAIENLDIIPTSIDLSAAEIELIGVDDKEFIIRNAIAPIKDNYDYIIIDCPPSLSMLTINAMTTADSVLVPIQCEYYALEGLSQLIHTVELVKERLNPILKIEGVVFTMYDALHAKRIRTEAQQLMENERLCFSVLSDYARVLRNWKVRYAPQSPDQPVHARFTEACRKLDETEYYLDILCAGDSHERAEVVQHQMEDGKLDRLRRRLEEIHKEELEDGNDTAGVA